MEKLHIEKNTIQETLVIPLYARKLCTELYPDLFQDPRAAALMERLDYDFGAIAKKSGSLLQRFGALEIAMRQMDLSMEVTDYLREHPRAAVVNMGCGLDQTGENCDNGSCRIYNLDMPDVIAVRDQLLPVGERTENIPCDLHDPAWFDRIDSTDGAVFFASGVFYYFKMEQARDLINRMAVRFPGGRLVLDTCGKAGLKMMMKTVIKEAGIRDIAAFFHVADPERDIKPWLQNTAVSARPYMTGYNDLKSPSVPAFFRWLGKFGDNRIKMQILRLDFDR